MYQLEEIISFIKDQCGLRNLEANDDIFLEQDVVGDDFHELIEAYAKKFNVDLSNYLWYFHADEEGHKGLGGYIFTPPYENVQRIPVTPEMMLIFANNGKWEIKYPAHKIPKRRWDLLINTLIGLAFIIFVIYKCTK